MRRGSSLDRRRLLLVPQMVMLHRQLQEIESNQHNQSSSHRYQLSLPTQEPTLQAEPCNHLANLKPQ